MKYQPRHKEELKKLVITMSRSKKIMRAYRVIFRNFKIVAPIDELF